MHVQLRGLAAELNNSVVCYEMPLCGDTPATSPIPPATETLSTILEPKVVICRREIIAVIIITCIFHCLMEQSNWEHAFVVEMMIFTIPSKHFEFDRKYSVL